MKKNIHQKWVFPSVENEAVLKLSKEAGISEFISKILIARGIKEAENAKKFLQAPLSSLPRPHIMKNMEAGVDLVKDSILKKRKIAVYSDYDADGISSAAILTDFLKKMDCNFVTILANRFGYGYGIGIEEARKISDEGAKCAIIADCGTSDFDAISYLKSKGIKTIVIDHHRPHSQLPPAEALINPLQTGCDFPAKELTASGICFYFIAMLARKLETLKKVPDPRDYLDFAAIGTVCDIAPMIGANRCIVRHGGKRVLSSKRPAFKKMLTSMGITSGKLPEEIIARHISPKLNAPGRMTDALPALEFLLSNNEDEANRLYSIIAEYDEKRKQEAKRVEEEARFELTKKVLKDRASIILYKKGWHPGVLGIVANKILEYTGLPSGIIGIENGIGRGSLRAPDGMDIFTPLSKISGIFERMGGHSFAVGFTIKSKKIPILEEIFEKVCSKIPQNKEEIKIDTDLDLEELDWHHLEECERLAPFGSQNPPPVIIIKDMNVVEAKIANPVHLKGKVKKGEKSLSVIGFNLADHIEDFKNSTSIVGNLRRNFFGGEYSIELLLIDFK